MRKGIAVAGTTLVDKIYEISAYPSAGELTQISAIKNSVGGCVPNTAADIKNIKPDLPVLAIGKLGADEEGEYVKKVLSGYGVDVSGFVVSQSEKTSFTDVMSVVGGQRTFFCYAGAGAEFGLDDIDFDSLEVKMLHLGYFLLSKKVDEGDGLKILKEAQKRGISTSIDLVSENSDRYSIVLPCLPYTDNLIINEVEAGKLTMIEPKKENLPLIARKLSEKGVKERVIIHTPELGLCYHEGRLTTLPSFDLPAGFIKGTTGAGDAFCAGSLVAIHEGLSDEEILRYGSIAATASLCVADATSGVKEMSEMQKICENLKRKVI